MERGYKETVAICMQASVTCYLHVIHHYTRMVYKIVPYAYGTYHTRMVCTICVWYKIRVWYRATATLQLCLLVQLLQQRNPAILKTINRTSSICAQFLPKFLSYPCIYPSQNLSRAYVHTTTYTFIKKMQKSLIQNVSQVVFTNTTMHDLLCDC